MTKDPFIELADIEPKEVRWLFEPFIPYGMISIIEGDPGLGKSFLAMHIATMITMGAELPNGQRPPASSVVYLSAEDDNAYTIRPRMQAMGADLERVIVLRDFMALDQEGQLALAREIAASAPALIVLDPLIAFMEAGSDPYRPTVIRPFLGALRQIAESSGAAVLIVRHLAKARHDNALYKGTGSIDQIGVARSAVRVAKHPDDDSLRVFAHLKHNLSPPGKSLLFEVVESDSGPVVRWLGETDLTVNDLDGAGDLEEPSALETAEEFLRAQLESGSEYVTTLRDRAETRGVSKRTLDRAKEKLRVTSRREKKGWLWSLPSQ